MGGGGGETESACGHHGAAQELPRVREGEGGEGSIVGDEVGIIFIIFRLHISF